MSREAAIEGLWPAAWPRASQARDNATPPRGAPTAAAREHEKMILRERMLALEREISRGRAAACAASAKPLPQPRVSLLNAHCEEQPLELGLCFAPRRSRPHVVHAAEPGTARRAVPCCRQFSVAGSAGGKKAGRCSKGSLQRLRPGQASKVPISALYIALSSPLFMSGGEQRRASSSGSVFLPCVLICCQCDVASS